MHFPFTRKWFFPFFFLFIFFCGLFGGFLRSTFFSEDIKFDRFTDTLFKKELSSNTLNLHYTLANPSAYGIHNTPISLGSIKTENISEKAKQEVRELQKLEKKLHSFTYKELSEKNQLTYEILSLYFRTEASIASFPLLSEPLSPTLGIQAQLPVLLAEYTFRTEKDLTDYLSILNKIPSYFQDLLAFEQEKSAQGFFMSDTTAQRIIDQCNAFILEPEDNYLISVFEDKLSQSTFLSQKQKERYLTKNKRLIIQTVIPSYEMLIQGLKQLKGSGKNPYGLAHYANGQAYYLSLIQSSTGIYDSIETITEHLHNQMHSDYLQIQRLLTAHPDLPALCQDEAATLPIAMTPEEMLTHLQQQISYDFPPLPKAAYEIKYVHEDLAPYLSPAFYLTPPVDTLTPNAIYINSEAQQKGLSLYSTLAHEGFPGHLYQTLYFTYTNPNPIRYLISNSGFVEGWASYIEQYAYQYAPADYSTGEYLARNRSFYLCLYSLLDIYIHYYGWTSGQVADYLEILGITEESAQKEIYQILIEDPANYLKYGLGSLYLQNLKTKIQAEQGKLFDLQSFHKALLTIGPAPFPVIERYIHFYMNSLSDTHKIDSSSQK